MVYYSQQFSAGGTEVVVNTLDSQTGDPGSIPTETSSVENFYLLNAP